MSTTYKVSDFYKYFYDGESTPETGFLFPLPNDLPYPEIPDNESNFIEDYEDNHYLFDFYFNKNFGERRYTPGYDVDTLDDAYEEFITECASIYMTYVDSWARLYYALSLSYNPIYNVDGTTETVRDAYTDSDTYGQRQRTDQYGQKQLTDQYGATSESETIGARETTNGARSDSTTNYQVAFDSALEKESGKSMDSIGAQTINEGQQSNSKSSLTHTDTHTDAQSTDTHTDATFTDSHQNGKQKELITRKGNQGVTMTQTMLDAEWNFRRNSFFKGIFDTIQKELGLYYE